MTQPLDTAAVEAMLARLTGVIAARVRTMPTGTIASVDVLAEGPRAPTQVVADVRSLLYARYGIQIAPEQVRVDLIDRRADFGLPPRRWRLAQVRRTWGPDRHEVEVCLRHGQQEYVGRAVRPQGICPIEAEIMPLRAVFLTAEAVLRAVEQATGGERPLRVEDVRIAELAGQRVVLVAVSNDGDPSAPLLLGMSIVVGDVLDAAAKATLDAVNRRVLRMR